MNTAELFLQQAKERPDAPAIIETGGGGERTLTFAQLDDLSARGAALLRKAGLKPGDTMLVLQPMSMELYIALTALFRVGVVAMFLDPSAGREHIARCCGLRAPEGFLGGAKAHLLRLVSPAIRQIPRHFALGGLPVPGAVAWSRQLSASPPDPMVEPCAPETPALLTFTSGSTGQPKAAVRTHGLLAAQHTALSESIRLCPGQIDLTTLPIFALANLASGVTTLIPGGDLRRPAAIDPGPVIQQIRRHRPVRSGAPPAFFERLFSGEASFPEFTELYTGGAPVFPVLLDRMQTAAPHARVVAVYGSTEAEPIADIALSEIGEADRERMLGGGGLLAGPPVEHIRLRIVKEQWGTPIGPFTGSGFDAVCCPATVPGEIVVSGAHVLPGYLHGQGDSETKFRVEDTIWHRTGDSGYLDERGRLWLLGRTSALISDSRGTLYPFAVEVAARQTPGVRRAALVHHKEKRILLLEPERFAPAPDLDTLRQSLSWAELDDLRLFAEIPMDRRHNSKVDYQALKARL